MLELHFPEVYDLMHTFDCGQLFRFQSFDNGKIYYGPLADRIIKVARKDEHTLLIDSNKSNGLEPLVNRFFRVQDDYITIRDQLAIDDLMQKILKTTEGLHLLLQDKFECIISFYLSQCSNIPRIKLHLNALAKEFGQEILYDNHSFNLFPTRESLLKTSENYFRQMKFGYRAEYINLFIQNYPSFIVHPPNSTEELNKKLQSMKGVGQKVADCIQLFAFGDVSVFPVDVWMEKFIIKYYNKGQKMTLPKIRKLGQQLFGSYVGYAQEFIFHYARCYDTFL